MSLFIIDGIDYSTYRDTHDIDGLVFDNANGNFEGFDQLADYAHDVIVLRSMLNGQFIQARQQCSDYGLNYNDELNNFKNQTGE